MGRDDRAPSCSAPAPSPETEGRPKATSPRPTCCASRRLAAFPGDQGYDARALREQATCAGALVVIPDTPTRRNPHPFDASRYGARNAIARMVCRLTDDRRTATRLDRLACTFPSCVARVSAIT